LTGVGANGSNLVVWKSVCIKAQIKKLKRGEGRRSHSSPYHLAKELKPPLCQICILNVHQIQAQSSFQMLVLSL
jgi:hypothetical protein